MKAHLENGFFWAGLAVFGFSLAVIFGKLAINSHPGISFYNVALWGWTSGILGATLSFYLPIRTQRERLIPELRTHKKFIALITALTVGNGLLWFCAMEHLSGGVVSLLDQNAFIWSFALGVLFLGERFSQKEIFAILVMILGLIIISGLKGEVTWIGVLASLGAGFFIAVQSVVMKRYKNTFNALSLTFWRAWGLCVATFIIFGLQGKLQLSVPLNFFILIFISQYLGLFIGRAAYIKAHEYLPIGQLSFMMLFIPVIVLSGAFLFLQEGISAQKLTGSLIMLLGLFWFLYEKRLLSKD